MRDPKRKPTHPGEVLRQDVLPEIKMTQEAAADLWELERHPKRYRHIEPIAA